jgi:hypothetical protein
LSLECIWSNSSTYLKYAVLGVAWGCGACGGRSADDCGLGWAGGAGTNCCEVGEFDADEAADEEAEDEADDENLPIGCVELSFCKAGLR